MGRRYCPRPWGDLFFTDAAEVNSANQKVANSHLNELLVNTAKNSGFGGATTGFAAAPTVLETLTDATPGNYDDVIVSLYINSNSTAADPTAGTVYFGTADSGIYALPNTKGVVNTAGLYAISNQGADLLMQDAYGNFFFVGYDGATSSDALGFISVGGPTFAGVNTTANMLIADSSETCTPTLTIAFSNTEFTAVQGTCSSSSLGSFSFVPLTVTYSPATGVSPNGDLTVTDTTSSASTTLASKGSIITGIEQQVWGPAFTGGGVFGSDSSGGSSGAINSKGVVVMGTSYGNGIQEFTAGGTVVTNLGTSTTLPTGVSVSGAGGMAIDSQNYLYASNEYGNTILKFPMNADGTYGTSAFTTTKGLPTCKGDGVAPDNAGVCQIVAGGSASIFGIASLTFDSSGNLIIASDDTNASSTATNPWSLLQCGPTCLYGASPTAPVVLYAEPLPTAAQDGNYFGSVAADSAGNLFFTNSLIDALGSNYSDSSGVYELPVSTGAGYGGVTTGYAAAPTQLVSFTPSCAKSPCSYNNEIDAVAVVKGNVYFADQYTGIYWIGTSPGTLNPGSPIAVATPGAKMIVPDGQGNFYYAGYNNTNGSDTIGYDVIGSAAITTQASVGKPSSVSNVYAFDNFGCDTSPALSFSFTDTQFTATAGGCGDMALGGGSSFPVTLTFSPNAQASGTVTETMTVTDTVNGGTGTGKVSALASTAQPITGFSGITSPVAFGGGPYTLSATGGASGNPLVFSVDSASTATASTSGTNGTTLTITGVGNLLIDVNQAGGVVSSVNYSPGLPAGAHHGNPGHPDHHLAHIAHVDGIRRIDYPAYSHWRRFRESGRLHGRHLKHRYSNPGQRQANCDRSGQHRSRSQPDGQCQLCGCQAGAGDHRRHRSPADDHH